MPRPQRVKAEQIGLPLRPFLYTLDQISVLISVPLSRLERAYIYYENRSIGTKDSFLLSARNIAPPDESPDWRIEEGEFIRWMKRMGYKYYDRSYVR